MVNEILGMKYVNCNTCIWKYGICVASVNAEVYIYFKKRHTCIITGTNMGVAEIDPHAIRHIQRSYETSSLLMPNPKIWPPDKPIITTSNRTYTAEQYQELFTDIGYQHGQDFYQLALEWDKKLLSHHPGVPMYCIYSTGVDTLETAQYEQSLDEPPVAKVVGDGDGTVNRRSLVGCAKFYDSDFPFHMRHVRRTNHHGVLSSRKVVALLKNLLISW